MERTLVELGFRGYSIPVVETAIYVAAFLFCLYWARGLFLAREGVQHWLARLFTQPPRSICSLSESGCFHAP